MNETRTQTILLGVIATCAIAVLCIQLSTLWKPTFEWQEIHEAYMGTPTHSIPVVAVIDVSKEVVKQRYRETLRHDK